MEKTSTPTTAEVIQFATEQIEVRKLQFQLQDLNTKIAALRLEEIKSLAGLSQFTKPTEDTNGTSK